MLFKRKSYPIDLTDAEWEILKALLPPPNRRGRRRKVDLREILNAIYYVLHTGCQWDYLPHDFPAADTVFGYFNHWKNDGTWGRMTETLRGRGRAQVGKDAEPSAAILDSQSVKPTEEGGERG